MPDGILHGLLHGSKKSASVEGKGKRVHVQKVLLELTAWSDSLSKPRKRQSPKDQ